MFLVVLYVVLQGLNSSFRNVVVTADQWSLFSKIGPTNPLSIIIKVVAWKKKNNLKCWYYMEIDMDILNEEIDVDKNPGCVHVIEVFIAWFFTWNRCWRAGWHCDIILDSFFVQISVTASYCTGDMLGLK